MVCGHKSVETPKRCAHVNFGHQQRLAGRVFGELDDGSSDIISTKLRKAPITDHIQNLGKASLRQSLPKEVLLPREKIFGVV